MGTNIKELTDGLRIFALFNRPACRSRKGEESRDNTEHHTS